MAAVSPITVNSLKVVGLAGPITAAVVTLIRLFERVRNRKFGYDDGFAALSLSILIIFVVALFVHLGDPSHLTYATRVGMYYVLSQGFYGVIWTARLSILFSIVRITPAGNYKKLMYGLVGSFVLLWVILFAQVFWVCENQPLWKDTPAPQCALGRDVAIAQLISDIYADATLIAAPLRLLWNLGVTRAQRNRLLLVFSSSVVTSAASLIHAYYVLRVGGLDEVFVAVVEICVSLLVCNLAVLVGLAARIIESRGGKSHGLHSESFGMSRSKITTAGIGARSVEFTSTRTVDDGLNVKIVDIHTGPFGDSTYPKEGDKAFHYPKQTYHDNSWS
ncbi:hypothetical protein D9615_004208 [Tricholomella constricta]|uniref:Rhodopsin domain-containing protein n=1 Tax=Tricholomella constricta TaxID=117010 RepID=A0A8H5M5J4_9AGAR|nr:hypothetical protein D9615_004208 [Tricholomella constricta]